MEIANDHAVLFLFVCGVFVLLFVCLFFSLFVFLSFCLFESNEEINAL